MFYYEMKNKINFYFEIVVMKYIKEAANLLKKIGTLMLAIIFFLAAFPSEQPAEAAANYTYVKANYNETVDKKGTVTRTLKSVTVMTSKGKYVTYLVNNSTQYYVNHTKTTIGGLKAGMSVTVYASSNKATKIEANTNSGDGSIVAKSKQISGTVTEIDPNGLYIKVKPDGGSIQMYTVNNGTDYFKTNKSVDFDEMYVGDRVKLKFASTTTKTVSEIEIISSSAVLVQELYKGNLNAVNTSKSTMTIKNTQPLLNWQFGTSVSNTQKTFTFTNNTSIYVGNTKITKDKLKNYNNSEMYFVTSKQFSKEVVNKIIVLKNNEFTFYQSVTATDLPYNHFVLSNYGSLTYHKGSILIRNGRLIEPEGFNAMSSASTMTQTSAFVIADGVASPKYAHVVQIANDGLSAPNLAGHQLYFGMLELADLDAYKLEISTDFEYKNNSWKKSESTKIFGFSNSTDVTDFNGTIIVPEDELDGEEMQYGYFYVKNGHVQAIHFVGDTKFADMLTGTGRIQSINSNTMIVENASQWLNNSGEWTYLGKTEVDLDNVMFIRNGKVVDKKQLKARDRVVLMMDGNEHTHIVIVNE